MLVVLGPNCTVQVADVSVMPQPLPGSDFGEGLDDLAHQLGRRGGHRRTTQLPADDRSYWARLGCSISCQAMVGTPTGAVDLLALDELAWASLGLPICPPSHHDLGALRKKSGRAHDRKASRSRGRTAPTEAFGALRQVGIGARAPPRRGRREVARPTPRPRRRCSTACCDACRARLWAFPPSCPTYRGIVASSSGPSGTVDISPAGRLVPVAGPCRARLPRPLHDRMRQLVLVGG